MNPSSGQEKTSQRPRRTKQSDESNFGSKQSPAIGEELGGGGVGTAQKEQDD